MEDGRGKVKKKFGQMGKNREGKEVVGLKLQGNAEKGKRRQGEKTKINLHSLVR